MNYISKYFFHTLFFLLINSVAFAQTTGKLSGKVKDKFTGETLVGLAVTIPGTSIGVGTDFDGNYTLANLDPGVYTILFKYIGYASKSIAGVKIEAGKTTELSVIMEETVSTEVAEVVITSTFSRETINALYSVQQNAVSVSDGISADVIRRSPDKSSADILKRVSGASIQEGRFVIVRGMNDRYNLAYLNNSSLPSTEPDRKAFTFDIFPAAIIDNITIIKTFSPEYKADFAGGIIKVNTKQIPETNSGSITFTGGYNQITTFKSFTKYKGGKTDWLGLDDGTRLLPNQFPTPTKFLSTNNAENEFNTELAKTLNDDYSINNRNAAPNFSFQATKANVFKVRNIAIGTFAAVSYSNSNRFSSDTRFSRDPFNLLALDSIEIERSGKNILWGGIVNIGLKIRNHSTISIRNLYNVNSEDKTFVGKGYNYENQQFFKNWVYLFYSNQMYTGQLEGDHIININDYKPKINWNFNYNDIKRNVPDYRQIAAGSSNDSIYNFNSQSTTRFFNSLNEKYYSSKIDVTLPLNIKKVQNDLKIGYFYEDRKRDFFLRDFNYRFYPLNSFNDSIKFLPLESAYLNENIGEQGWNLNEAAALVNSYDASTKLNGFYLSMDTKIGNLLRANYGIRSERFNLFIATRDGGDTIVASSIIDTTTTRIFPAINITFPITVKENLRFSYSETINRPEFREAIAVGFLNYETNIFTFGSKIIKDAFIKNYDFKYEYFPAPGEVFSVSTFYKSITNPIEFVAFPSASSSNQYTYVNASKGFAFGLELEGRKNLRLFDDLLKTKFFYKLTLYSNLAIIESESNYQGTDQGVTGFSGKRVFQGQSPFLYNGGLLYDDLDKGITAGILVNYTGQRLFAGGGAGSTFPDRFESARTVVDLQLGKRIKRFESRITVNDLFATNLIYYLNSSQKTNTLNYEKETDATLNVFRFGTQINLRLGFNF